MKNQFKKQKNSSKRCTNSILLKFFDATLRSILILTQFYIILSLIAQVWTLIFIALKIISQIFVRSSGKIKRKRLVFNRTILFYFKEKPTTPLLHGGKTIKKHMFQWNNLFIKLCFHYIYVSVSHLYINQYINDNGKCSFIY